MPNKVKIELRPYDALAILRFLRKYVNDENKHDDMLTAIHETVNAYESEIYKKLSLDQLEDATVECSVNYLAGRHPPNQS